LHKAKIVENGLVKNFKEQSFLKSRSKKQLPNTGFYILEFAVGLLLKLDCYTQFIFIINLQRFRYLKAIYFGFFRFITDLKPLYLLLFQ